jgi:hypothetical protein
MDWKFTKPELHLPLGELRRAAEASYPDALEIRPKPPSRLALEFC